MQRLSARLTALAACALAALALTSACNSTQQSVDEVPRMLRGRWVLA